MMDVLETLKGLEAGARSAVYLRPGASEPVIHEMQVASRCDLNMAVPDEFLEFLRFTNGAFFEEAEHLVPDNLDVFHAGIMVLGHAGNVEQYVFDKRDQGFHIINFGFPDEPFESFDSFEELLLTVMSGQQVI